MTKVIINHHTVEYWETDQMGIVHHSNYIKWFESARTNFLKEIDYPYDKMEDDGFWLPVYNVEAKYLKPARFGDDVFIETSISELSRIKIVIKYVVKNRQDEVISVGKTTHPVTDPTLKIVKLDQEMYSRLENYLESN